MDYLTEFRRLAFGVAIEEGEEEVMRGGKCPAGRHWNSDKQICDVLGVKLLQHRLRAQKLSVDAHTASREGKKEAGALHKEAAGVHGAFAHAARWAGFHHLGSEHEKRAGEHKELA